MPDILHRVGVKASPKDVYDVLATRQGLAAWWTNDTRATPMSAASFNSVYTSWRITRYRPPAPAGLRSGASRCLP